MIHWKAVGALSLLVLGVLFIGGTVGMLGLEVGQAKKAKGGKLSAFVASPPAVTSVAWGLDPGNGALIDSVTLKLGRVLTEGSLACVQVRDIASSILADGCEVLAGDLGKGSPIEVGFDSTPSTTASAAAVTGIGITIIQPVAPTVSAPNGLEVTDVAWGLDEEDTILVGQVRVRVEGVSGKKFEVQLTLKDDNKKYLQKKKFKNIELPTTIVWDLDPAVPAEAIVEFKIKVKKSKGEK